MQRLTDLSWNAVLKYRQTFKRLNLVLALKTGP